MVRLPECWPSRRFHVPFIGSYRLGRRRRTLVALVSLFLVGTAAHPRESPHCSASPDPTGAWTDQAGKAEVVFETNQVVIREGGLLRIATVLKREPCQLELRDQGLLTRWRLSGDRRVLRVDADQEHLRLTPLAQVPPTLDATPFPLPPERMLPPDQAQAIAHELSVRMDRDQETATKPSELAKRPAVVADNLQYLRGIVARYGWVDIPRFGKRAAAAAIAIVKHADDLPLMEAALPVVERDARENGGGQELLAIFVDELLIMTGHKQKYGTQIARDGAGRPYAVPVEDPSRVEEYRKAIGIKPWAEYLKQISDVLYNGTPVRIPGPEE